MIRFLIVLAAFELTACSQKQALLSQDYHFFLSGGQATTLHQGGDTLYERKGQLGTPGFKGLEKHYRILGSSTKGHFKLLKLESLDSVALTTEPYPETRFYVFV